jgi:hypothetical protein
MTHFEWTNSEQARLVIALNESLGVPDRPQLGEDTAKSTRIWCMVNLAPTEYAHVFELSETLAHIIHAMDRVSLWKFSVCLPDVMTVLSCDEEDAKLALGFLGCQPEFPGAATWSNHRVAPPAHIVKKVA